MSVKFAAVKRHNGQFSDSLASFGGDDDMADWREGDHVAPLHQPNTLEPLEQLNLIIATNRYTYMYVD